MTQPLTPAAQAVKDAVLALYQEGPARDHAWPLERPMVTTVLRALADQVVPEEPEPDQSAMPFSDWNLKTESWDARMAVRADILAIAAELDGGQ